MAKRWMQRPEGSNWGEFGDDDQHGRLNLLTPARRLAALKEVQAGEVFCLSHPLDKRVHRRSHRSTLRVAPP